MAGKAVPGILVAVGQGCIVALAARFVFHLPCRQPQPADGGHGLLRAGTGRDRALHLIVLLDPAAGLSRGLLLHRTGSDPLGLHLTGGEHAQVFQWLAAIDPLTHFIVLLKGSFEGLGWSAACP